VRGVGAAASPGVEFVAIVESGPLEAQALLLVESLRRNGGRHAAALVTAVSPRAARRPARSTVRALRRLGARVVDLDLRGACPAYPTSWRVHALAELERRPGPEVIVQLDSDTLFLDDVGPLCAERPGEARPVDVKGMGSSGPTDRYEPYWAALCELAGVGVQQLPFVTATVDGARIRATHNGGFVAARRARGLFARADEVFRRSAAAGLRPHAGSGLNVVAGVGEVGEAGSEWWGSAQAVVSVAAASLGFEIGPLPAGVNVPMHLWRQLGDRPSPLLHAHYHWLLADPLPPSNPMLDPAVLGSVDACAWLRGRVPLATAGPRGAGLRFRRRG
jgi:hypothetical protein